MRNLGIVLDNLGGGQKQYTCIYEVNKYLDEHDDIDISLFFVNNVFTCITPKCGQYNISETSCFRGPLICTSAKLVDMCVKAYQASKYWYIMDLQEIRNDFGHTSVYNNAFNNNLVKFTRNKDYYDYCTNIGMDLNDIIVPDFDIHSILEIIYAQN